MFSFKVWSWERWGELTPKWSPKQDPLLCVYVSMFVPLCWLPPPVVRMRNTCVWGRVFFLYCSLCPRVCEKASWVPGSSSSRMNYRLSCTIQHPLFSCLGHDCLASPWHRRILTTTTIAVCHNTRTVWPVIKQSGPAQPMRLFFCMDRT